MEEPGPGLINVVMTNPFRPGSIGELDLSTPPNTLRAVKRLHRQRAPMNRHIQRTRINAPVSGVRRGIGPGLFDIIISKTKIPRSCGKYRAAQGKLRRDRGTFVNVAQLAFEQPQSRRIVAHPKMDG